MQKNARIFLGILLVFSALGILLRRIELNTTLDTATMLMDFRAVSALLLALSVLAAASFALTGRAWLSEKETAEYGRVFRGKGFLAVSAVALLLMLAGALLCLRSWKTAAGPERLFPAILAVLGVLAGAGWFTLALEGERSGTGRYSGAVLPVLFAAFFLVAFYKTYAHQPALLYTLYPFLGLCCALAALHLAAGFTVGKPRARWTFFFSGLGVFFCAVSILSAPDTAHKLFFAALTLMLAAQGVCLLQPLRPLPPVKETDGEREETEAGSGEGNSEGEVAPDWKAPEPWNEENNEE